MADQCITVLRAAQIAAAWHADQKSKGLSGAPISITCSKSDTWKRKRLRAKPEPPRAALLHDAIEDQEIAGKEIAQRFGDDVASLVEEVTDDKSLPSWQRKRLQVEHAPGKSRRAKILKLADKVSNMRSIASDPPDWSNKRRLAYVQWGRAVVAGLRGASSQLERLFDQAASEAEEAIVGRTELSSERMGAVKKTKHEKGTPRKWNRGNSERGKVVGTDKHGKGLSAPRNPSKTPKKTCRQDDQSTAQ